MITDIVDRTIELKDLPDYQKKLGLPIRVIPNFQNALYVYPSKKPLNKKILDNLPTSPEANAVRAVEELRRRKSGGIVVGDALLNPTVLAHEKGHQLDKSWLSRMAPTVESIWGKYQLPIVGTLGAAIISAIKPEYAPYVMGANLGVQALSSIPLLYSESKASSIAKDFYPEADTKLLDKMYNSYLKQVLVNRLLIPAIAHGTQLAIDKASHYVKKQHEPPTISNGKFLPLMLK